MTTKKTDNGFKSNEEKAAEVARRVDQAAVNDERAKNANVDNTREVVLDERVISPETTKIKLVTEKPVEEQKTETEKEVDRIEEDRTEPKTSKEVEEIGKKASTGEADTVPTAGYTIKNNE
jgi:hypothetical protein